MLKEAISRPKISNFFCKACYNTFTYGAHLPNQVELADIEDQANRGCEQCIVIHGAVRQLFPFHVSNRETASQVLIDINRPAAIKVIRSSLTNLGGGDEEATVRTGDEYNWLNFYTHPGKCLPWEGTHQWLVHDHCGAASNLEASVVQINKWLEECASSHKHCVQLPPAILPKRTLFVGKKDTDICLSINTETDIGHYTTLSHCWGGYQPIVTTQASLSSRLKGIQWSDLPKTFQDAIEVTRNLGILHIWIDSLCIVQDDKNDWAVESSKMASIYSNSYLNISANAAANAQEGCFTRSEDLIQPVEICLEANSRSMFSFMDIHDDPQPLMRRGWAFQERRLSRRSVLFNKRELVWVCHSETICECKSSVPHSRGLYLTERMTYKMEDWWHILVSMYSELLLSKSEDKLPALSGMAHMYVERKKEQCHPGKYLAGLWEANAIGYLCWAATTPSRDLPHYRAPTWSWASIDAKIEYPINRRDPTLAYGTSESGLGVRLWSRQHASRRPPIHMDKFHPVILRL